MKKKIKGITGNMYMVKKLGGAVANMVKVILIGSKIPEKWDKEKVFAWSEKYDKAFK